VAVIPENQMSSVIGRYAKQEIPPGRLIDAGMLSTSGLLTDGQAAVGIALQAGRFPAGGLQTGDVVQVVRLVDEAPKVIANRAVVGSVREPSEGAFGGSSNVTLVTLVVTERVSPAVAAAAMADQVSLVLIRRGDPTGAG
jgi:hypothetical protein